MGYDSALTIGGPAIIGFDGIVLYSEADITVRVEKEFKDRPVAAFGNADRKLLNVTGTVTAKPTQWKNLTKLFPHLSRRPGERIFGGTDKALTIHTLDGKLYTYARAAITGMPNLGLGVGKDLLNEITFRFLKGNATELSAANSVVSVADSAFADVSFDPTKLIDLPVSLAWGASPFDSIETEDGIDISFNTTFADDSVDSDGIVDMVFQDIEVTASFIPVGMSDADFLTFQKMQGTGVSRGASMRSLSNDLIAEASGVYVKCAGMIPVQRTVHGVTAKRPGSVEMVNVRKFTSGAADPVAVISTEEPV